MIKKLTAALLAATVIAGSAFAGQEVTYNDKKVVVPVTCFNDKELQLDVFGAYQFGNTPMSGANEDGFGGGIGINYFFSRYIGVGVEGYWIAADSNAPGGADDTTFHNVNGSLIFRLPMDESCLAPYAFIGGGATLDGAKWAVGFAGLGLEYRVVPNKIGIFIDGRWNYFGSRFDVDTQNNITARAGVRFVF